MDKLADNCDDFSAALRRHQRPRQRGLGFGPQQRFMMGDEAAGDENADEGGDQRGEADRTGVMLERSPEKKAAEPEDASPRRRRRAR